MSGGRSKGFFENKIVLLVHWHLFTKNIVCGHFHSTFTHIYLNYFKFIIKGAIAAPPPLAFAPEMPRTVTAKRNSL